MYAVCHKTMPIKFKNKNTISTLLVIVALLIGVSTMYPILAATFEVGIFVGLLIRDSNFTEKLK